MTTLTYPDPLAAVRAYLLGITELTALVGQRVYVPELPGADATAMPRAAVVLSESGGPGDLTYGHLSVQRMDVRSYGPTFIEAWHVHAVVHRALKAIRRVRVGACLIHVVTVETGVLRLREPEVNWPLALRVYQVKSAELTAA